MTDLSTITADRELKSRHRTMWALGDYPRVADELVGPLGPRLADALEIAATPTTPHAASGPAASSPWSGRRILDVAAGSGNFAVAAGRRGAEVVASDLTPELLAVGRERTQNHELTISWETADAEHLPYPDASFDMVASCIGVMFAPHHQPAADELLRVCRPGGTIGVLSWTPTGFIGRLFAAMKPAMPTPPPGAEPPPLWGQVGHVEQLLGRRVVDFTAHTDTLPVTAFGTAEDFRDYFRTNYGPTIVAYRAVADDPERSMALDRRLIELAQDAMGPDGSMDWEYVIITADKR